MSKASIFELKEFIKTISVGKKKMISQQILRNQLYAFLPFSPHWSLHISFIISTYFSNELGREDNVTQILIVLFSRTSGGSREKEVALKKKE